MTALRILSAIGIIGILGWMAYDARSRSGNWDAVREKVAIAFRLLVARIRAREGPAKGLGRARLVVYGLVLGTGAVLVLTGFLPIIILGEHMTGFMLIVHVTVAPIFVLAMAAVALLWSHQHRFSREDWESALSVIRERKVRLPEVAPFAQKKAYWVALSLTVPLILTAFIELFPLFDTEGGEFLISLHGYSGLLLLVAALMNTYLLVFISKSTPSNDVGEER